MQMKTKNQTEELGRGGPKKAKHQKLESGCKEYEGIWTYQDLQRVIEPQMHVEGSMSYSVVYS